MTVDNGTRVRVVRAPDPWVNPDPGEVLVFLAGGIVGCADWQAAAAQQLALIPHLGAVLVYNPRRAAPFAAGDEAAHAAQGAWEFQALDRAQVISVWFPAEGVCAGSLYELGRHLALRVRDRQSHLLAVGVDPGYRYARKVAAQVALACGEAPGEDVVVSGTLAEHVQAVGLAVLGAREYAAALRARAQRKGSVGE